MTGGKTYARLSAASLADPQNTKVADEVQTVFRGETLRGLLLNAYAFDTMGNIAFVASIAARIGAAVMRLLTTLAFVHASRAARPAAGGPPAREMINA